MLPDLSGEGEVSLSALPEFQEEKKGEDTGELEEGETVATPTSFLPPLDLHEEEKAPTKIIDEIEAPPEIEIMEEEGFPLLQSGRALYDDYFAYFDTYGPLKVVWESWEAPKSSNPVTAWSDIDPAVITRFS